MTQARARLSLRKAAPADAHALSAFASRAFWDTYRDIDDPGAIATYVAEHLGPRAFAAVIADSTSVTLLAEVGSILAGYAILSRSQPPSCVVGSDPIELSRFYLGATFIGCGYGRDLMRAVHAQARHAPNTVAALLHPRRCIPPPRLTRAGPPACMLFIRVTDE